MKQEFKDLMTTKQVEFVEPMLNSIAHIVKKRCKTKEEVIKFTDEIIMHIERKVTNDE